MRDAANVGRGIVSGIIFRETSFDRARSRSRRALDPPDPRLPTSRISLERRFRKHRETGGATEMSSLSRARQSTTRDRRSYRARARVNLRATRVFHDRPERTLTGVAERDSLSLMFRRKLLQMRDFEASLAPINSLARSPTRWLGRLFHA